MCSHGGLHTIHRARRDRYTQRFVMSKKPYSVIVRQPVMLDDLDARQHKGGRRQSEKRSPGDIDTMNNHGTVAQRADGGRNEPAPCSCVVAGDLAAFCNEAHDEVTARLSSTPPTPPAASRATASVPTRCRSRSSGYAPSLSCRRSRASRARCSG